MPLGAFRINGIAKLLGSVAPVAFSPRASVGVSALNNAQIDTAISKFGGASGLFDGADDKLTIDTALDWDLNSDWTVEAWVYPTANTGFNLVFGQWGSVGASRTIFCGLGQNNYKPILYYTTSGGSTSFIISADDITASTWTHIAWVAESDDITIYVDGVAKANIGSRPTFDNAAAYDWNIGANAGNTDDFAGNIDELRVSQTARYTTGFTAPTAPFQNDNDTVLLLHMNGTDARTFFADDNGRDRSRVGVSLLNNAAISTTQSKFGGTSLVLDGTGDYAFVDEITLGNEWTLEGWFRFDVINRQQELFDFRETNNAPGVYYVGTDNKLTVFDGGTTKSTNTISSGTWYHIAFVSDPVGNTVKGYVDGVEWLSHAGANAINAQYCFIGQDDAVTGGTGFDGYMDEIRFSTVQRYTTGFTAPTAPFVNDTDTALLLHFDNTNASTDVVDDNGSRHAVGVYAINNAQVDTAQSKYGKASALFDGNGDYLLVKNYTGNPLAYGTGDFTIEMFIRFTAIAGLYPHIWDQRPVGTNGAFSTIYVDPATSKIIYFANSANRITATNTVTTGTWYHLAISRSGTSTKMFINGVQEGSTYTDSTNYGTGDLFIGAWHTPGTEDHDGHIDEIRVSNVARYTANFTAPTAAFVNDSNTLLLLHMDGTDATTTFIDDNN